MITQDNDTLYAEKNSNEKQNPSQPKADKSETKNAMIAKLIAASGAGLAAGAGAAYAAGHFAGSEAVAEPDADEAQTQGAAEQQTAEPSIEERVSTLEEKERIREQQERVHQQQEQEHQQQEQGQKPEEEQKPEENDKPEGNDFFQEHEVKIEAVEPFTLDNGTTVNMYSGTVDGHQAVFMDDGNGRVDFAIVDENDNGSPDTGEIMDFADNNISTQELAQYQVSGPTPEVVSDTTPEVNVVAVEHDVDIEGHTVDVAAVTIDDQPVMLIDANQNGEVDLAIADLNQNNQIDEGEIQDVRSAHIAMPTADDVTASMAANVDDGTEDYSNNANIEVYEI